MDFTDEQHTDWFAATELPGEDGLYKRRAIDPISGERGRVEYCLWSEGWWYEGSPELTSALNHPLRKSRYQAGVWEDFEWCGVMPGSYERPDVQEVKVENFVTGFFGGDKPTTTLADEIDGAVDEIDSAVDEGATAAIGEAQQFSADFFGVAP